MSRRPILLALVAIALPLVACVPPDPGTPTTTTTTAPGEWPGATCLDAEGDDGDIAPDLAFSGTPNERGNAVLSATITGGVLRFSGDGTCSGQPVAATTIVKAATQQEATAICASLEAGTDDATSYTGSPWTLPDDAWACAETYFL